MSSERHPENPMGWQMGDCCRNYRNIRKQRTDTWQVMELNDGAGLMYVPFSIDKTRIYCAECNRRYSREEITEVFGRIKI